MNGFYIVIIAICVGLFLSVFDPIALIATLIFCIAILFDDRLF